MIYASALLHSFSFQNEDIIVRGSRNYHTIFGKFLSFALDDSLENCAFIDHELAIKSNFDGILCFSVARGINKAIFLLLLLFCCLFLARLKSSCDEGLVNDIFSKKCINCVHKYHIVSTISFLKHQVNLDLSIFLLVFWCLISCLLRVFCAFCRAQ